jgi:hypothetical protein
MLEWSSEVLSLMPQGWATQPWTWPEQGTGRVVVKSRYSRCCEQVYNVMPFLYNIDRMFRQAPVATGSREVQVLVHSLLRFVVVGLAARAVDDAGRAPCWLALPSATAPSKESPLSAT